MLKQRCVPAGMLHVHSKVYPESLRILYGVTDHSIFPHFEKILLQEGALNLCTYTSLVMELDHNIFEI